MAEPIEVMLADKMTKEVEHYLGWRIQEKTDGIRALIVKEAGVITVWGRNQTKAGRANFTKSVPEIADYFADVAEDFIIDCELMSKDFLTLQTKVRTTKSVIHDPGFYVKVFDILKWDNWDSIRDELSHDDRYNLMQDFISACFKENQPKFLRSIVQAPKPLTPEYLDQCLQKIVDRGGEGLIIKNPAGLYRPGKRSKDWTKVLPYREMDVLFTGAIEGEGKYKGTLGALEAFGLDELGNIQEAIKFNVGTGWDDALRNAIWEKAAIDGFFPIPGKIKMKELYPTGIPRMPVYLSFNVDKEIAK